MKDLKKLRTTLCKELDEISSKGELTGGDLEAVHKLTDTIKNIDKIENMEYSQHDSMRYDNNDYRYDDRYSNRRHYVRGHYSRDSYANDDDIMDMLGEAMGMAKTKEEKEAIRECLNRLR